FSSRIEEMFPRRGGKEWLPHKPSLFTVQVLPRRMADVLLAGTWNCHQMDYNFVANNWRSRRSECTANTWSDCRCSCCLPRLVCAMRSWQYQSQRIPQLHPM